MFFLKIVASAAFALAGGAKLAGAKPLAEQFTEFGLPKPAMYLVGVLEIAGAVGLFVEPFPRWAAVGLAGLMVGAVANHMKAGHRFEKSAPSLALLLITVLLAVTLW